MLGKTISHYRIQEKLGGGGMGVVYKGRDTLLDRAVAIKVLSPELLADETAARGFIREAKAASALNHPNILTVHDLVEAEGVHFLVMEFVEGQTLRARIGKKGMEVKPLLDVSLEVAEALAAAHKAGIVHRDLKPENIMVRTDGHIKVVDFGLAKLLPTRPRILATGESTMPLSAVLPQVPGVGVEQTHIAGTLPYMSPEQLTGKPLDHRTDIYSFGVVLYEMATGQQPHQGRTTAEIVESILTKEPRPATDFSRVVPDKLQEIIGKTMEKDPADRYQHMEDIVVDLRRIKRLSDSGWPSSVPRPRPAEGTERKPPRTSKGWLAAFTVLLVIAISGVLVYLLTRPPRSEVHIVARWGKEVGSASLSADGNTIAFDSDTTGQREIYVMLAKGGPARQITDGPGDKFDPRFSPDGTEIMYTVEGEATEVRKIPTLGGPAERLLNNAGSADWSPDGERIVYARELTGETASIWVSDLTGQNAKKIYTSQFEEIDRLRWSPDGRWIFFNAEEGFKLITPDGMKAQDLTIPEDTSLGDFSWSDDTQYLFYSRRVHGIANIWKISVVDGQSVKVTDGSGDDFDPMPLPKDGGLMYANARPESRIWQITPEGGQPRELLGGGWYTTPAVSPDGKHLAYLEGEPGGSDTGYLSATDIDGQSPSRITAEDNCWSAVWSPDSTRLAYSALVGPIKPKRLHVFTTALYEKTPRQVTSGNFDDYVADWNPDGNYLLFVRVTEGKYGLMSVDLRTGNEALIGRDFEYGKFSRSGQWILAHGVSDRPERKGLWLLPTKGGPPTKLAPDAVSTAKWTLQDRAIVYSLIGRNRGKVDIWKLSLSNGRPIGTPSLLLSFPATSDAESEWDSTDDLSKVVYPRVLALANFYKLSKAD